MFATHSSENTIAVILRELDLSIALFACFQWESGVSRSVIERCLAGKREFYHVEAEPLVRLAKELKQLQSEFPIRLDWTDVNSIRAVLSRRREQTAVEKAARAQRACGCA